MKPYAVILAVLALVALAICWTLAVVIQEPLAIVLGWVLAALFAVGAGDAYGRPSKRQNRYHRR